MSAISSRWLHASALAGTTLYISGGTTTDSSKNEVILSETLALDVSKSWTVDNPAFTVLAPLNIPLRGHSMNKLSGLSQLLIAGGESSTSNNNNTSQLASSTILTMDVSLPFNKSSWSVPVSLNSTNTATFHRLYHASLVTGKNGALLQGGYRTTSLNTTLVSSLTTLSPTSRFVPSSVAPVSLAPNGPELARHTMTLTTDGLAVVLGGIGPNGALANLTIAHVLDTQAEQGEWRVVQLQGTPPDPRMSFSTVLVNSTTMLVYGGTDDFKSAFWVTFYLDLDTWTWSSPAAQGSSPRRWGHTANMAGSTMIVAFGQSSHNTPDTNHIALLDTITNTWVPDFREGGMTGSDVAASSTKKLGLGVVLGIVFVGTVAIVGGLFYVLVRRRRRLTRNSAARERMGDQTTRSAVKQQRSAEGQGLLKSFFGIGGVAPMSKDGGANSNSNRHSKRMSQVSLHSNPISVAARMAQAGSPPSSLGYPEVTVQQGCGMVPASSYIYPNQACSVTDKDEGEETRVVYHTLSFAQQEALKLSQETRAKNTLHHVDG